MPSAKNPSQDFILKKEFIDLQVELKKFVDETSLFTLSDIIKDPLVIHSLDDYINAYKELDDIKRTKKTLKKLLKFKKKNVNLLPFLQELQALGQNDNPEESKKCESYKVNLNQNFEFKNSLFPLKALKPYKELAKERMLQIFKNSISKIENIRKITIPKPVVNRNFTVSSSHSHLLKKIEKNTEKGNEVVQKSPPQQKMGNEITTTASFRNGVLKNTGPGEKGMTGVPFGQPNIVKATRSPHQSLSNAAVPESVIKKKESEEPANQQ